MPGFEIITEAARENKLVEIVYAKKGTGEVVQHVVEPYSTRGNRFFGFRTDIGEIRAFIIDNIISATKLEETFSPRWPVEL